MDSDEAVHILKRRPGPADENARNNALDDDEDEVVIKKRPRRSKTPVKKTPPKPQTPGRARNGTPGRKPRTPGRAAAAPPPPAAPPAPPPAPPPPPAPLAPPPPPGQPSTSKAGGPKLKPLVWNKVPKNRLKGTVWQAIKDEADEVVVDAKEFEELFLAKPVRTSAPQLGRGASSGAGGSALALLDPKRANNLSIILSQLKLPFEKMRRAVLDLDAEVLPAEALCSLLKCVPSPEELELVTSASVEPAALGLAERFVYHVGAIPRLRQRLECFLYMQRFNAGLHALYTDVQAVTGAAEQLRGSAALRRLLATVLALGNRLNAGSFRAGAEGFKTESLTRLVEIRTNGAQGSLLQFAVGTMAARGGAVSVAAELEGVKRAAKLSPSEMADEVGRFAAGLEQIKAELAAFGRATRSGAPTAGGAPPTSEGEADRFKEVMQPFTTGVASQARAPSTPLYARAPTRAATPRVVLARPPSPPGCRAHAHHPPSPSRSRSCSAPRARCRSQSTRPRATLPRRPS